MDNLQAIDMRAWLKPEPSFDFVVPMHQQMYQQILTPTYPPMSVQELDEFNHWVNKNNKKEVRAMTVFDDMVEFLDLSYKLRDQIVPCLMGPVGIGKTEAVMQHCKNVKAGKVVKIVASQILPTEVSGIAMPNDSDRSMDIYDHKRLSTLEDGDILFFDELLEADQSVLKACLTLIESREMLSGKKLPDIQIIAATNPSITTGNLADNIKQRFVFKNFRLNERDAINFIKNDTGLDLSKLLNYMTCQGQDVYNILTPRSLTKMARWVSTIDDEHELDRFANQVNSIWNDYGVNVGEALVEARREFLSGCSDVAIRKRWKELASDYDVSDIDFMSDAFSDIVEQLENIGVWDKIKDSLENEEV